MIKWIALLFAWIALVTAADERKVSESFARIEARVQLLESAKCQMMVVMTPSGESTVCVLNLAK